MLMENVIIKKQQIISRLYAWLDITEAGQNYIVSSLPSAGWLFPAAGISREQRTEYAAQR
jgi:hypothetical protein